MEKSSPLDRPKGSPTPAMQMMAVFGLSNAELVALIHEMRGVVVKVGCPVHIQPLEVVHDAFVVALGKPISERPSPQEQKKFVAWMCELAKYAALTNRKSKHRVLLATQPAETDLESLLSTMSQGHDRVTREKLRDALRTLDADEQAFLLAHYVDDQTIQEMAVEQKRPWTTMASRHDRILEKLRAALRISVGAVVLFFTKEVRARGSGWTRTLVRTLPQATHTACALTVTVACGSLVPSNGLAMAQPQETHVPTQTALPPPAPTAASLPTPPPADAEVAPVKPDSIDDAPLPWSAADMKLPKLARCIQATLTPFAFLVLPAVTQVACAGSERSVQPPPQPEEVEDDSGGGDPYDNACESRRARGSACPTRAEWYGAIGLCPDGTRDCQK